MQLFQTKNGVGRRIGQDLELLETEGKSLYELICSGSLASLKTARVTSVVPLQGTAFESPVAPSRLFMVGLNYQSHLDEIGIDAPEQPPFSVADIGDALGEPDGLVTFPSDAPDQVDHECEVAIVIGSNASRISATDAWNVIAGVTGCNDVSARDLQRAGFARGELMGGKLLPGFKPFGPGLLIGNDAASTLSLKLTVNGECRQESDTDDMIYSTRRADFSGTRSCCRRRDHHRLPRWRRDVLRKVLDFG
jgi:2-keto-4-pentenoate hydratase/2-oxohepta-3-ene-1,7-dioic acid hydratase in catechol pathway